MGEIFAVEQPAMPMPFTGERMTSDAKGQIEYEHLHRYCFARLFCRGKQVVDVASGEGYGSALLAQVASRVVGVELGSDSVIHAARAYERPNLRYVCGDARRIPLQTGSADVVVSFETIEHLYEHDLFFAEIRRILRPDGVLVISSPDSEVYSPVGADVNPFHVHELTAAEFKSALSAVFPHTIFYAQRALIGSVLSLEGPSRGMVTFDRRSDGHVDAGFGLPRAPYLVGVASAVALEPAHHSLYIDLTQETQRLTSRFGVAQAEARIPVLEQEIAALHGTVGERDAALAAEQAGRDTDRLVAEARIAENVARADAAEARERVAQVELEAQNATAEQRLQERDAAREQATGLQAAVLASDAQVSAHQAQLAASAREGERLTGTLAAVEGQLQDSVASLQTRAREVRQLRAAVKASDSRCRERDGLIGLLQAEVADRRQGVLARLLGLSPRRRVGAAVRAGDRYTHAGDWTRATRHYRRALAAAPDLLPIWVQLGHVLKEQGDHAGAEAAYRRALTLNDAIADTHLQLGHLLKLRERWGEAADAFAAALHRDPALADAKREWALLTESFQDRGDAARDAHDWAAAARWYERVVADKPEAAGIWVQLGHARKEQGDYAGAEEAYREALALDGAVADTHLQLGHLLKLQARRSHAAEAYAAAIRLDPALTAAHESLRALVGYSPSETERALLGNGHAEPGHAASAAKLNGSAGLVNGLATTHHLSGPDDRYGALFAEASRKRGGRDTIWLGVIDWHFRIQRPQHLATNLADTGARVFYVSLVFDQADAGGRFRIVESPHPGVFEIRLRLAEGAADSIYQGLGDAAVGEIQAALDEVVVVLGIESPVVVVEYPTWQKVAFGIPGATIVYDCLDLATGFNNASALLPAAEAAMFAGSDLVVAASRPLVEHVARLRPSVLIRNAAEVEFFARGYTDRPIGERPVIGYFGAIAEWFAIDWIETCAAARPEWEFRLIGRTDGCDISRAARLPNVHFLGEQPYADLPELLREFDVALIPFKLVELTRCTNPVKLYEYMSAGKPVVASPMPEVVEATDLAYIAEDAASFIERIAQALAEDTPALREKRQEWAREHDWANRAAQLEAAIDTSSPSVSVVVLTYNNWSYTEACLGSLELWSDYPDLEIIVVDNASTDGTRDKLRRLARRDPRVRVILNETNLGFAAGNNVGIRAAQGEYVILLNNDTYVTRGWVRDLIRPMQLDAGIGLTGPLTNNIGNEQKIRLVYGTMPEMQDKARDFVRQRLRQTVETDTLAFFCVALRRSMIDVVGLLDEAYGIGFFEDDDYCRRAKQAGYRLAIVDDVFVHHHLSASFDALGARAGELMARNRALYEERWGPWTPHQYRAEPGFG